MRTLRGLLFALLLPTAVAAQSHADDQWNAVRALPAGADLEVRTPEGLILGNLDAARDDGIALRAEGHQFEIGRDQILRVVRIGDRQTGRYARRGFVIGAAIGAVLGAFGAESNRAGWAAFMSGGMGALGAGIGAIDGLKERERTVVYDVRRKR